MSVLTIGMTNNDETESQKYFCVFFFLFDFGEKFVVLQGDDEVHVTAEIQETGDRKRLPKKKNKEKGKEWKSIRTRHK